MTPARHPGQDVILTERHWVVVNAALLRLAKAWERWDQPEPGDEKAAGIELEQARDIVRAMGVMG